jgi:sarcosine oxidase subunit beta
LLTGWPRAGHHELAEPFQLERFHTGRLIDEAAAAGIAR